jgi:hypothetical protein
MRVREEDPRDLGGFYANRLQTIFDLEIWSPTLYEQRSSLALHEVTVAITAGREAPHLHGNQWSK